MTVATIIVNYNAGETLQQCVTALLASNVHTKIFLVDNASSDESVENLQKHIGNQQDIEFLFNTDNPGFAPAVNAVARCLDTDWVLILNPDCILERDTLGSLKSALEGDARAALAGPAVRDEDGQIQRATLRRFPDPWKSLMTASGLWRLGKWLPIFHGVEVELRRVGLNSGHIKQYNLPESFDAAKPSDPNYRKFINRFGSLPPTELDALHPKDLKALIKQALEAVLDMSEIGEQKEIEDIERRKLKLAKQDFVEFGRNQHPELFA